MVGTDAPSIRITTERNTHAVWCDCGWSTTENPSNVLAFRHWQCHVDEAHGGRMSRADEVIRAFAMDRDAMRLQERLVDRSVTAQADGIRHLRALGLGTTEISTCLGLSPGQVLDLEAVRPHGSPGHAPS